MPPTIAALEANIILRHRSETSASSSIRVSIREISSAALSSSFRFKIDIRKFNVAGRRLHAHRWDTDTKAHCQVQHAVKLFSGLVGESPQNGRFLAFDWRFWEFSAQKSSNVDLQRLLATRKAHDCRRTVGNAQQSSAFTAASYAQLQSAYCVATTLAGTHSRSRSGQAGRSAVSRVACRRWPI
jgi:hypothetical protein